MTKKTVSRVFNVLGVIAGLGCVGLVMLVMSTHEELHRWLTIGGLCLTSALFYVPYKLDDTL